MIRRIVEHRASNSAARLLTFAGRDPTGIKTLALAALLYCGSSHATPPQRIVTLSPSLAELVCAAGACDRLVGVSAYTSYPLQAAQVKQVGDAFAINLEAVLATRPDLILAWYQATPAATIARLRHLGLKVIVPKIEGLDDIGHSLRRLGDTLGTEATADRAASDYAKRLSSLRKRYSQARRLRVFYQLGTHPAYTINRRSPVSAALALCGGDNIFGGMPRISGPVSAEAVAAAAPQVVFYGNTENRAEIQAYWAPLSTVPAVQHRDLLPVAGDLLAHASPRVLDGITDVCQAMDRVRRQLRDR